VPERAAVEEWIPRLAKFDYHITSPRDPRYNCFAWAVGDTAHIWDPSSLGSGVYWPPGIAALPSLNGVLAAYAEEGFAVCESGAVELGFEKIAIFVDEAGDPRHAARQLRSGAWTSKLGPNVDIEHRDVQAVGGLVYGEPQVFMRRHRLG